MSTGRVPATGSSPLTTKGDLYTYSTTQARLAVGNNGETLVADSSATTGLRWQGDYAAGKNKIINGAFDWNQRAFSTTTSSGQFVFDRFFTQYSGGTTTTSAEVFTPGAAPAAPYEATNFCRILTTSQSAVGDYARLFHRIENVRTFANQTATLSFYAKANSGTPKIGVALAQNFGSGGSSPAFPAAGNVTISTSWARYSLTVSVPSISGKTIGAGSSLGVIMYVSAGSDFDSQTGGIGVQNNTFDIWGLQFEAGSVATPFQTATGTLAGELAACQRYYVRMGANSGGTAETYSNYGSGYSVDASNITAFSALPVQMRVRPTAIEYANLAIQDFAAAVIAVSALTLNTSQSSFTVGTVNGTVSGSTAARGCKLLNNNNNAGYLAFSAEL